MTPEGFKFLKYLGAGQFGRASLIINRETGEFYVSKFVNLADDKMKDAEKEKAFREYKHHGELLNQHITAFKATGSWIQKDTIVMTQSFCDDGNLDQLKKQLKKGGLKFSEA